MEGPARDAVEQLWPGWSGRLAKIVELDGGITNRNFKVTVDGDAYVLRMPGAKTSLLGIDREAEYEAGRRAFQVGVGPEVVAYEAPQGWLVTTFVDGQPIPLEQMRRPEVLARVARALRAFHDSSPIPGRFDAWAVVQNYRETARAHGVEVPPSFGSAWEVAERIGSVLGERELVPCHNDLLNANFLDDGSIRIVDWEYAGMGDRFFDLANFSVNHKFEIDDDRRFLDAYFGVERETDLAALRLMRYMSDFREAMWGVLQSGISELQFDFDGYAARHFARMEGTASDPDFERYLSRPS